MIDIRDFDPLVGSGNPTLDTAALEAAFLVGGRVYAPGIFHQNRPLVMSVPGTELVGDGKENSIIQAFHGSLLNKQITMAARGCATRHIGFDGNRSTNGTDSLGEPMDAVGNMTCAIYVNAPFCQVEHSRFVEYGWQGVLIRSPGAYFSTLDSVFEDNGSAVDRWGAGLKCWTSRPEEGGGPIPYGINIERCHFARNFGLVGLRAGGGIALDAVDVGLWHCRFENNENNGGQVAENGANGITRRWRGGGNTFVMENEAAGCSTTDYEVTGLGYSFAGDRSDGGKGAHWNFQPIGNAACGDATITGSHIMNKGAGLILKNSYPTTAVPSPTGGARAVVFGPAFISNTSLAAVYAESHVSDCLIDGVRWAGCTPHINSAANSLPSSQIDFVNCR